MKKMILLSLAVIFMSCDNKESKLKKVTNKLVGGKKVSSSFKNVLKATANKADAGSNGDLSKALNKAANEINEDAAKVRKAKGNNQSSKNNTNNPEASPMDNLANAIDNKVEAEGGYDEFQRKLSKALDKAAKEINEEAEEERNKK